MALQLFSAFLPAQKRVTMRKTLAITVAALAASAALATPAQATALDKSKAARLAMALQLTQDSQTSFDRWVKARVNRNTEAVKAYEFDWSSNGCSVPEDIKNADSWKLVFLIPCTRHDFGYRNVKKLSSTSSWKTFKKGVDSAFHGDMKRTCDRSFSGAKKIACKTVAYEFYAAVKLFG
ncbi:phospholipase A2 [Nonomuraea sp. H19]|uniref:phospholipase A2 n=1 Tax=Nonomuraea sp. H19 TaxID=3452206 RepID=UPI003F88CBA5